MSILTQKLTKKEKGIYLQALAFIMSQKGKANPALKSYLRVQALEIGVDEKQLEEVKLPQSALELCRSIKKIETMSVRRFIIREMIMLAVAAHELQENEVTLIYQVGNAVGIDTDRIDDLFMWAARGLEWQIEGAKMVEED